MFRLCPLIFPDFHTPAMNDALFEQLAGQWTERSGELGEWVMERWVNRRDIWGRYLAEKYRGESNTGAPKNKAITACLLYTSPSPRDS